MKLVTNEGKNGLTPKEFYEYLKTPVPSTTFTLEETDEIRKQLEDAHKEYGGLGISATQIGIRKRACYIKFNEEELFLLNPFIKERSEEGFLFMEGCLSIPKTVDKPIRTIRAAKVVIQTDNLGELTFEINPEGDKESVSPETLKTVVVQHEIDHLDGITIKERVYSTTIQKKNQYGRNDKVVMKSPEGEMIEVKFKKANDLFLKGYEIV